MALNIHDGTARCFQCGKIIEKDEHCFQFRGTKSDGSGYETIYFHAPLCALEFMMIVMKDNRFALYSEKYKLNVIPRTIEPDHLKIEEWHR